MLGEDIEAFAPAAAVPVARLVRVEAGLLERDLGARAEVLETYGHDRRRAGPAILVVPCMRHHQQLVRNDLAIDTAEAMVAASRIAHLAAPFAAGANVALAVRDRVAARRRPLGEMFLLGPAAPDQVDRRVEHAFERQRAACNSIISCGHVSSPWFSSPPVSRPRSPAARADKPRGGRNAPPTGGDS